MITMHIEKREIQMQTILMQCKENIIQDENKDAQTSLGTRNKDASHLKFEEINMTVQDPINISFSQKNLVHT